MTNKEFSTMKSNQKKKGESKNRIVATEKQKSGWKNKSFRKVLRGCNVHQEEAFLCAILKQSKQPIDLSWKTLWFLSNQISVKIDLFSRSSVDSLFKLKPLNKILTVHSRETGLSS